MIRISLIIFIIYINSALGGNGNTDELTFRVGASVGREGACAELYEQTAQGYKYFFDWLSQRQPHPLPPVTDASGRTFAIRLQFRLLTHDCTDAGSAAALDALIRGTPWPRPDSASSDTTTSGATSETTADSGPLGPVHLLLGGNGVNAQDDALQANTASRLLLHCCTARDSVYLLDLPYVYGLFTPASMYTGAVLRAMAFSGLRRVAVASTTDSALHVQLCGGVLRQTVPLAELRPGFGAVVTLNYTDQEAARPGFWDEAAAVIAAERPDALVACGDLSQSSQLVKALRRRGHWLSALWLASYGKVNDFISYLGGAGEYALTTVQWMPSLPYADPFFGTAAEYGAAFTAATGMEASYFSAAASASGYVLLTALRRAVALCNLSGLYDTSADAFMWQPGALSCVSAAGTSGVRYDNVSGQAMLRNVLNTLQMDTFFGPVGFNHYRQNVYHPPVVTQVLDNRLAVVVPLDLAEQRLVLPIPMPTEQRRGPSWASTTVGIVVITLLCCLGCLCVGLLLSVLRRWLPHRLDMEVEVEIDPEEVQVDVAPVRNVDGSFEPGEGTYRGTRVKLVVATELLAPVAAPAPLPLPPLLPSLGLPGSKLALSPLGPAVASFPQRPNATSQGQQLWTSTGASCDVKNESTSTLRTTMRDILNPTFNGVRRQSEAAPLELSTGLRDAPARVPSGLQPAAAAAAAAAAGWLSRRSRKQVSAMVWRAMRLQHPSICPVLGIAWEWPGLLEGGGTVPVVVRQWYELGDLAQLIENETVPLPLLTKASIAQGVAEGLAYLHAQEPPIIGGSLEPSRIIIDKHFNPHIFMRLINLDSAYVAASAAAAAAAASAAAAAAAATPANTTRGSRMASHAQSRRDAAASSPCRTPTAVRSAHQVVLVDAALYERRSSSQPGAPASCDLLEASTGSRVPTDPWVTAATGVTGEPSVRSKAQDILKFGRLLGALFLGVSGVARINDSVASGRKPSDTGAQPPEPSVPFPAHNNCTATGTSTGSGAGPSEGLPGAGGSALLRKQSTGVSELGYAGVELVRQAASMDEHQLQQLQQQRQQQRQLGRQPSLPSLSLAVQPNSSPPSQHQNRQLLLQQQRQQQRHQLQLQQDALMLQALDEVCPEVGLLARSCMHPDPTERPSFAAIVAVLESRVRLALSGGLGLAGLSRLQLMSHGAGPLSFNAARSYGGGGGGTTVTAGLEADLEEGLRAHASALVAARVTAAGSLVTARRSCSFQLTAAGQALDMNGMRRPLIAPDDLLFDLFPPKVAHALCAGESVQPERYECVSIFFSDVVGYTDLCGQLQPFEVMDLMHRLYSRFDDLIRELRLFKVETVGDAYLAVGNLRWPQPDSHARLVAQFAFAAVRAAGELPVHPDRPELGHVRIRVGLHCGPVVGSVVGTLNRRYCLFGDAVNTAARMEHNSEADRVHCSGAFAALVSEQWRELRLLSRGVRQIKGKGPMETFWVEDPQQQPPPQRHLRQGYPGSASGSNGDGVLPPPPLPSRNASARRVALAM